MSINGEGWWTTSSMREGGTGRESRQQADDRWERMRMDGKDGDEVAGGWHAQRRSACAEGMRDDPPNDESCVAELAKLKQRMEERGKEEVEVEYSEGGVNEASFEELKTVNKWAFGGGIVCPAFDEETSLDLEECSHEGKDLGT